MKTKMGLCGLGTSEGLNKFDLKTEKFIRYRHDPNDPKSLSHDNVISIIEDDNGALWVATYGGGLNKFDKSTESFSHFRYKLRDSNSLSHEAIQTMYKSSFEADVIWIATSGGGINKFDIIDKKFTRFMHDPNNPASLSTNLTTSVYEDNSGLIWVGTAGKGICKFNKAHEKIHHYKNQPDDPSSLFSNHLLGIYEDQNNRIWIGTDGFGLDMLDRKSGVLKHYEHLPTDKNSLCSNTIYSIVEERPGLLWISTIDGLSRLQVDKDMFSTFKHDPQNSESISHNIAHQLYIDHSDILWIGTIGGGLNKLVLSNNQNPSEVFRHYMNDPTDPSSISNNLVSAIFEDNDGFLWLGTVGGGLNKFDIDAEKFYHYQHDPNNPNSLSHININVIYVDSKGNIWVGTYGGGLNKFDSKTETFIRFTEMDGLANDIIYGILEDNHGNLWISTKNGLSKFNPNDVDKWGKPLPGAFKNYYKYDGFQDNEFTYFSYFQNSKGELFFGGVNGLNIFHPDSLIENRNIPEIVLTEFKVLNKPAKLDSSITVINKIILPHDKNFFSFRFAALDLTTPGKNQYAYKLEGLETDWIYSGNFNFANYTAVKPGKYTFRVKGSNNDGIWNEEGTSIKIIITPPWWRTNWAYAFYGIFILTAAYSFWRFQTNHLKMKHQLEIEHLHAEKLEELDHMKSQFFANISHEFRTPLTLIKGPIKQILSGEFRGNLMEQCRIILRYCNRLLNLINQILDLARLESGQSTLRVSRTNISQFLKGIVRSFASLAERTKINLKLKADEESLIGYVDRDKLQKIVTNLLSNAFKFTTEGGEIAIRVKSNPPQSPLSKGGHRGVEISVSNTGPPIPPDQLDKIFDRFYQADDKYKKDSEGTGIGLALTKELVEVCRGEIRVESEPDKLTTFTVLLPIGKEHLKPEEILEVQETEDRKPDTGIQMPLKNIEENVIQSDRSPASGLLYSSSSKTTLTSPTIFPVLWKTNTTS
jgi:two-component system sensor histidine kinase ChiS